MGVNDDGSIAGVAPEALGALANAISNVCTGNIKPPVGVLTTNVSTRDGVVVVIEVPDGWDKPYQDRHGEFWQKRGADKRRVLERSELKRLLLSGRGGMRIPAPFGILRLPILIWRSFGSFTRIGIRERNSLTKKRN